MFSDVQLISIRYTPFITFCFALPKTKMSKYLVCFDTSKNQVKQKKIRKGFVIRRIIKIFYCHIPALI